MVITVSISAPSSAEVGTSFKVSGTVRDDGEFLSEADIAIYVDGNYVTGTTTDENGYYSKNINISEIGVYTLKATAVGASATRSIIIHYIPYVFSVSISAPSSVNAGQSFTVSGQVKDQYGYGYGGVTVTLYRNGSPFASIFADSNGYYSRTTSIITAGTYTLKAKSLERWSPERTITIEAVAVPPPPVPTPPPPPPPTPPPTPPPEVPVYEVRFACIPGVGGVKCTLDGIVKYSNAAGICSFFNVSRGAHSYSIVAPEGWSFVSGDDVFGRPLYESGTTVIEYAPYPEIPYPVDQPWMLKFVFEEVPVPLPPVVPPPPVAPPPPPGVPVITVSLQASPRTQQYEQPIAFSGSVSIDGIPEKGLTVEIRDASTNKLITVTETDDTGYYYVEWTPTYDWIGSFNVWAIAKINPVYFSIPVAITVTEVIIPPPPVAPPTPPPTMPPTLPPDFKYIMERFEAIYYVLWDIKEEIRPITIKANTYKVMSVNLSTARPTFDPFYTSGFALTVLKCTGTMEMRIGDKATDSITIEPILYPQMLVIDKMDFDKFYVKNSAQPGKVATIIVWRRE